MGVNHQLVAIGQGHQPNLGCLALHRGRQRGFAGAVNAGNRNQLGRHRQGKNARISIASGARNGFAAQRRVNMDVTIGNHLGARVHHRHHHQIAATGIDLLTRTQRFVDHQRAWCRRRHLSGYRRNALGPRVGVGGRCGAVHQGIRRGHQASRQGSGHLRI